MEVNDDIFAGLGVIGEKNRQNRILELQRELEYVEKEEQGRGTTSKEKATFQVKKSGLIQQISDLEAQSEQNIMAYEALDRIGGKEISLLLPIVLFMSLLTSYFLLTTSPLAQPSASGLTKEIVYSLKDLIRYFSEISGAFVW